MKKLVVAFAMMVSAGMSFGDVEWPTDFWMKVREGRPKPAVGEVGSCNLDTLTCQGGKDSIELFDSRFVAVVVTPATKLNTNPPTGLYVIIK